MRKRRRLSATPPRSSAASRLFISNTLNKKKRRGAAQRNGSRIVFILKILHLVMSLQKEQTDKLYYSISEVSDMFEVNASTIRFWEKEFDILKPTKNKKGNRLFTQKDIENLRLIVHYVKEKGIHLTALKMR